VSPALYFDEQVPRSITEALRRRAVDLPTAQEDGRDGESDPDLLDRSSELRRVLVTEDEDVLVEAARRQRARVPFLGVIIRRARTCSIGQAIADLEVIAVAGRAEDVESRLVYLPLQR
jgi:predicted nuclease of predicted toxin-antitoxin system